MANLSTVRGVNNTLRNSVPSVNVKAQHNLGNLKVLYDYYVVDTADEFATTGLVKLMCIPKNAILVQGFIAMEAAGATGIFDLGWAASDEKLPGTTTGVELIDVDGIAAAVDPGAAAIAAWMVPTVAGYMKLFAAEVEVQADWSEVSADSGTDTLEVTLFIAIN